DVEEGIRRGMYRLEGDANPDVRLLASGPIVDEARRAARLLREQFDLAVEVWSVTSYTELARDAHDALRRQRLGDTETTPYVTQQLAGSQAPVVGASDYVRAVADSIRVAVPADYAVLGTDGFGRSDTRARLRDYFEVDARWIARTALAQLGREVDDEV
ncbi:MAG TPA: pyruvate dehydrogenase (acetyl-transferring), homodimeric type, partial [Burkholderiaceae bacterium]|nr:pyruvate dehydrogenase (acetyl-transferring), homodimeric type [Burkholderiaceae bacterium]